MRRIHNFFYSLQSESKRIWILFALYSHASVCSQTRFIHIIRFIIANIRIQANICLEIFAYQRIFGTYCFKLFRKVFLKSEASINIQLFLKIFASIFIYFSCKIRRFVSTRNKRIKPVLFGSYLLIFAEPNIAAHPSGNKHSFLIFRGRHHASSIEQFAAREAKRI